MFVEHLRLHTGLIITKYYILFQILFDTWFLCSNVQEPFVHLYSSYHLLNNLKSVTLPAIQYASTLFILFFCMIMTAVPFLSQNHCHLLYPVLVSFFLYIYLQYVLALVYNYHILWHCIALDPRKGRKGMNIYLPDIFVFLSWYRFYTGVWGMSEIGRIAVYIWFMQKLGSSEGNRILCQKKNIFCQGK